MIAAVVVLAVTTATAPVPGTARVSYVSGGSVYVDGGAREGIAVGDTLRVSRKGDVIALVRVAFAASHRASGDTLRAARMPATGDAVQFTPHVMSTDSTRTAAGVAPRPRSGSSARSWIRGRAGLRDIDVRTLGSASGHYNQIAVDLRIDGVNGGGGRSDIALDVRTRRTSRAVTADSIDVDALSRVYRALYSVHDPRGARRVTIGRQSTPTLASISLFDGVLAEMSGLVWHAGAFVGTQPEPLRMSLSGDVLEYGVFGEVHQRPLARTHWSAAAGAIASQHGGEPNRDFVFIQANVVARTFSGSGVAEVDVNRGWKRDAGEPALSLTNLFVTARVQPSTAAAFTAGFDNRRNVRVYRDRLTPETEFDDRYRQGAWAGATFALGDHVRLGAEARANNTGAVDRAHSWGVTSELGRLPVANAALRARYSQYSSTTSDTRLASASVRGDVLPRVQLELAGGVRDRQDIGTSAAEADTWMSGDVDWAIARAWYLNATFERDRGHDVTTQQLFGGVSRRF